MKATKMPRVKGYSLRAKQTEAPISSFYFDVSDTRVIGDVVVEMRGAFPIARPGDVARSLFGQVIHR